MQLVIITGLSGSGKSTALNIFEDLGYYTMDNTPSPLIEKFIELNRENQNSIKKLAVVIDIRSIEIDRNLRESLLRLKKINDDTKIIYLYSSKEVILKRYNAIRRPHPLGVNGDVEDGLEKEEALLKPIRKISDLALDTSNYNNNDLKEVINDITLNKGSFVLNLISFGYKYGISDNFDMVFDMRFLPNPFYKEDLKNLNGTDPKLKAYLDSFKQGEDFTKRVFSLINFLIPQYIGQGKFNLTVAFGCTGGKHRSVYMCEKMGEKFKKSDYILVKKHRDSEKW